MLNSLGEYTVALLINVHYQFYLQALCYNLSVLQLVPVFPTGDMYNKVSKLYSAGRTDCFCYAVFFSTHRWRLGVEIS